MSLFNMTQAAAAAAQNTNANTNAAVVNVRRAFKRGGLAASEFLSEAAKRELRKVFSSDPIAVGNDLLFTALFGYKKADKHDERGRSFSVFFQGNGISGGASLSAKVFAKLSANADFVAALAANRAKLDNATDALDFFIDSFGNDIYDLRLVVDPIELDEETPEYPEKEKGGRVYFNYRIAFADEAGEVMSDEEIAAHPAFIAWQAELNTTAADAPKSTM